MSPSKFASLPRTSSTYAPDTSTIWSVLRVTLPRHLRPIEGPLGFPMLDRQARQLDTLLKALPKLKEHAYRKAVTAKAPTELNPGEHSDVSCITTESVDRMQEVVIAKGTNDSQFAANPLETLQHAYNMPPVGKSLWRKRVKDGGLIGIKAKTQYPAKPESWRWATRGCRTRYCRSSRPGCSTGSRSVFCPSRYTSPTRSQAKKWIFSKHSYHRGMAQSVEEKQRSQEALDKWYRFILSNTSRWPMAIGRGRVAEARRTGSTPVAAATPASKTACPSKESGRRATAPP